VASAHPDDIVRVTKTSEPPAAQAHGQLRAIWTASSRFAASCSTGRGFWPLCQPYPFTYRQNVIDTMLALRAGATW